MADQSSSEDGGFSSRDPLRLLPLDALHREQDGRMVPFAGHAMPLHYADGVIAEHRWTRAHAGLFDVSHMGQILLSGAGHDQWLETLMPGDFLGLDEGASRYSLLLASDGGILDDVMVTRVPEGLFVVVNGATCAADLAHLRAHQRPGVVIEALDGRALLALQGPDAAAVLDPIVPGVSALRFMRWGRFDWRGTPLSITRSGYTGEDGFEISLPAAQADAFARMLLDRPEVRLIGLGARDSLRLEAGLPLYGHDLSPAVDPVEAGLAFAISRRRRAEGGFPGAAHILDVLRAGPARRRVGLRLAGRQPAREGAVVLAGDTPVGSVTSGGYGPSVECPIAMGYVAAACAAEGTPLAVEVRGRRLDATVVPLPFWKKNYVR